MEGRFYRSEGQDAICGLCPRRCRIAPGKRGACLARINRDGKLYSAVYGAPIAIQIDPIEKKPFANFLPGSKTFSIGTYGCNLFCKNCQNDHLSRGIPEENPAQFVAPEKVVAAALHHRCSSVAFTYNEPSIWAEYAIDIARLAHDAGLKTVLVSNGFITQEAAAELYPLIDAANIDLKSMDPAFYQENCGGDPADVLAAIRQYHATGGHLELTTLVIPGKNDSDNEIEQIFDFAESLNDPGLILHFSRFFPCHQLRELPATPPETLYHIREMGIKRGLRIALGNV
jgi:pyruvate formate lyase activating enzyme